LLKKDEIFFKQKNSKFKKLKKDPKKIKFKTKRKKYKKIKITIKTQKSNMDS
jgi:hypothetical protein